MWMNGKRYIQYERCFNYVADLSSYCMNKLSSSISASSSFLSLKSRCFSFHRKKVLPWFPTKRKGSKTFQFQVFLRHMFLLRSNWLMPFFNSLREISCFCSGIWGVERKGGGLLYSLGRNGLYYWCFIYMYTCRPPSSHTFKGTFSSRGYKLQRAWTLLKWRQEEGTFYLGSEWLEAEYAKRSAVVTHIN